MLYKLALPARYAPRLLQKERPQSVKVRSRAAIKRAPSLTARVHTPSVKPHVLTVRLLLCAAQASAHAGWACRVSYGCAAVGAAARSWVLGGHGSIVSALPLPSVGMHRCCLEAVVGRLGGHYGGVPVG